MFFIDNRDLISHLKGKYNSGLPTVTSSTTIFPETSKLRQRERERQNLSETAKEREKKKTNTNPTKPKKTQNTGS